MIMHADASMMTSIRRKRQTRGDSLGDFGSLSLIYVPVVCPPCMFTLLSGCH